MNDRTLLLTEATSGLHAHFTLSGAQAPDNTAFLWDFLSEPREMPAIHEMWTGPEISCPIPTQMLAPQANARALPPESATLTPQPVDLVLAYVPARM
ncbi:DUF3830 family protein [Variovorax sp. GT1P44]|uniref:DUF3830 family protein n=1 Tax=Variovorax sp. GT1P44 TaxID=3443742 RepID=UPI003F46AF8B